MAVVYSSPSSAVQVAARRRTPLGRVAAWLVSRAAGSALQKPLSFLLVESFVGRFALALVVSLGVGVLLDFTLQYSTAASMPIASGMLGAVAGLGAGGAGGAVAGAFWGWLVGRIADALVTEGSYQPVAEAFGKLIAWCLAAASGWLAGIVVSALYSAFVETRRGLRRVIVGLAILIGLSATALVLAEAGAWVVINADVSWGDVRTWTESRSLWLWTAMGLAWIVVAAIPIYVLFRWLDSFTPTYTNYEFVMPSIQSPWSFVFEHHAILLLPWVLWLLGTVLGTVALVDTALVGDTAGSIVGALFFLLLFSLMGWAWPLEFALVALAAWFNPIARQLNRLKWWS